MIQCVVCEDWLHGRVSDVKLEGLCWFFSSAAVAPPAGRRPLPPLCLQHLGSVVPDSVGLLEMICESCMNKNAFLWTYAAHLAGSPHILSCVPMATMAACCF